MKCLKIFEKSKEKLLEMCYKLFPEYVLIIFNDDYKMFEGNGKANNPNLLLFFKKGENVIEIHWFEFCWEILAKLMKGKTPLQVTKEIQLFGMVCFNKQNPVDYLYEMFKEQNIGTYIKTRNQTEWNVEIENSCKGVQIEGASCNYNQQCTYPNCGEYKCNLLN